MEGLGTRLTLSHLQGLADGLGTRLGHKNVQVRYVILFNAHL